MQANRVIAIILALCSIGYLWMAYKIPVFPIPRPIDSDVFPKMLGFLMLGLSVWLFFDRSGLPPQDAAPAEAAADAPSTWSRWEPIVVTSVAIAFYAGVLATLGFVLASALLTAGLTIYFGYRRHVITLLVSTLIPLFLYLLMTRLMNIHLPSGWLPF